jgi:GTP-binding protein
VGTLIKDASTGELLVEFLEDGQTWVACTGGRGGKGNAHFVSSTFQAPKFAQDGEAGEFKEVTLELKLLADAAIIGFPNTGKSTLISRLSAARPKIGDYPFTTLSPNLGVVTVDEFGASFVIADIPGLIEGAHAGMGLGHKFLKHIERTSVFVHLLDGTKLLEDVTKPGTESFENALTELVRRYEVIRTELGLFNEALLHKPEILALNKADLLDSDPELIAAAKEALRKRIHSIRGTHPEPGEPLILSAVSGKGLPDLLKAIYPKIQASRTQSTLATRSGSDRPDVILPDDERIRR